MTTTTDVETSLGRLHVQLDGDGPPALLWHSLFVDSTSWELLRPALARHRRLVVVDGPAHGASGPAPGPFTLTDCAGAAAEVLDACDVTDPVDWVGNAWGGHVGLTLAAGLPDRLRTLTTIGTPVHALGRGERYLKVTPLVALYRAAGPRAPVVRALRDALLGDDAVAAQPDLARRVLRAFSDADRAPMLEAMRSAMLRRPDLGDRLPGIPTPTLMIAARDDAEWSPEHARQATERMPAGSARTVGGGGHLAPLLLEPDLLVETITGFWAEASR
jgi:pimeloyl-ACP methyl ester carboxylesterase